MAPSLGDLLESCDRTFAAYEASDYPVAFSDISPLVALVYVDPAVTFQACLRSSRTTDALEAIYQSF